MRAWIQEKVGVRLNTVVAISGYFDPLHVGHLEYIKLASGLGDHLIAIINNDVQSKLKKGKSFYPEWDRLEIVFALKYVNEVIISQDMDLSVTRTLEIIKPNIFANGGDRHRGEIPETEVCNRLGIRIVDGLGEKIRSSSDFTGLKLRQS